MIDTRLLAEGWSLTSLATGPVAGDPLTADVTVAATVPGCVHTDLLAAGVIDDPYLDDAETRLSWIGRTDWEYRTDFNWSGTRHDRVDLVCAGLDTVATVLVDDVEVGSVANMHRSYRFDVKPLLHLGSNQLVVRFTSPYRYAEAARERLGDRPNSYDEPYNFIRKMACNFGWDWGPTLVTAGIWQPVALESWSIARLAEVRPLVTVEGDQGRVDVHVRLERAASRPLTLAGAVAEASASATVPAGQSEAVVKLLVDSPRRWWPVGQGDQERYPLTVTLSDGATQLDGWSRKIGFRSVRLDTQGDAAGSAYTVVVNDRPIFVRGVNWIPDDCFPSRVTRQRLRERMLQATGANVNYLRVWGGGRYESEDFYDLADELGLMVGQDFLFACAAYPEEEPFASEVAAEAREHVARLTPHPSLVVWTGNNENLWGYVDWSWEERLAGRSWGLGYYLDLLPTIVRELDPTRPYWPSSPYSGQPSLPPNAPERGTTHIWDVWNTADYTHYRSYRPRFVGEFGFQGPPTYATLRRAISDQPLTPDSPGLRGHQKQTEGNERLLRQLRGHLPAPVTFDDWHYATQLNQARAVRLGIEWFRSLRPHCMGAILWQLNDCWPVTSWSVVDGDGRLKPSWYALRRAFADRLLTIQPVAVPPAGESPAGGLVLVAVNDTTTPWVERVEVSRRSLDGTQLASGFVEVSAPPLGAHRIVLPGSVVTPGRPEAELIVAGAGGGRALWFFVDDVNLAAPAPAYCATVEPVDGGYQVTVTARTLLHDLVFYPDRLDPAAVADDALVTLLPGESAIFTIRTTRVLSQAALTEPPVLRCAGQLCAAVAPG